MNDRAACPVQHRCKYGPKEVGGKLCGWANLSDGEPFWERCYHYVTISAGLGEAGGGRDNPAAAGIPATLDGITGRDATARRRVK